MYTTLVVLVLVLIANAGAFSVMKSSSIVNRKTSMSMSMNNIPVDLITGIIKLLLLYFYYLLTNMNNNMIYNILLIIIIIYKI